MEMVSKEVFDRLVVEAASELDAEVEKFVKEQIKQRMREVTMQESRLGLLNDMEKLREHINKNVSGEYHHHMMGISPSVGCR